MQGVRSIHSSKHFPSPNQFWVKFNIFNAVFREENQKLSGELQKYLAVESLSKEENEEEMKMEIPATEQMD